MRHLTRHRNAEIAVTALRILRDQKGIFTGITDAVICEGISAARWPGRMEKASENVYLDGAHNPGGIAAFIQAAGKIQKRTGKKPGFYLLLWQIKNMKPWQKNFVKVLTGQESVWCI